MVETLKEFAAQHKIIIGACHAAPLDSSRLMASPFVPFVSPNIKKRTDPVTNLSGVKSIIVIGVGATTYDSSIHGLDCLQHQSPIIAGFAPNLPVVIPGQGQNGNISCPTQPETFSILSSLGVDSDYHIRVKDLLHKAVEELRRYYKDFKYKILVDSPTLDERALAQRAGLGFIGRNGLVTSYEFGSRFNIGCLLTDIPLDDADYTDLKLPANGQSIADYRPSTVYNEATLQGCPPNCSLCVDSCPSGALNNGCLDASRCISYLTQKKELTPEESILIKGHLYGCDICQDVCPFNAPRNPVFVNPQIWLDMDDETFARKYGHTAMLWRGAEPLRRNARASIR